MEGLRKSITYMNMEGFLKKSIGSNFLATFAQSLELNWLAYDIVQKIVDDHKYERDTYILITTQGDPLSLSFFHLGYRSLHNAFEKAVGNGFDTGVNMKNSTINCFPSFHADELSITTDLK
ncbi:hypothetical protein Tco_0969888 [Tanacetum coccineum]